MDANCRFAMRPRSCGALGPHVPRSWRGIARSNRRLKAFVVGCVFSLAAASGWASALAAARITAATKDPATGRIGRNSQGQTHGDALRGSLEPHDRRGSAADRRRAGRAPLGLAGRDGPTRYHCAGRCTADTQIQRTYQTLDQANKLRQRATLCQHYGPQANDDAKFQQLPAQRTALKGRRLPAGQNFPRRCMRRSRSASTATLQ